MSYQNVQPPFSLEFWEMPKKELKAYYDWFQEQIPQRIKEVASAVKQTPGYESWWPDFTPASLDLLGEWFASKVETRQRTPEELEMLKDRSSFPIDVSKEELTILTFSLAMDIGMYLSQVLLRNHRSLKWEQPFGSKKFIDYGQPVLVEFASAPLNPIRIVVTLAYGLARKTKTRGRLRELYDTWSTMAK